MDGMELKNFGEAARVTEKVADLVGNILIQLLQKQGYVEEKGVKALLSHVRNGGGTLTAAVSQERADSLRELLQEAHVPYVEIAHTDNETKEKTCIFAYRDCDRDVVKGVLEKFALQIDKSCHEVDLDTFESMTSGKPVGVVTGLTREEVFAFREAAQGQEIHFCVVADGKGYGIVADDRAALSAAVRDMCRNLSGREGREYAAAVREYVHQQDALVEQLKPEPGRVKYLVNAKNPTVFISVSEQGIITHSVGSKPEVQADGSLKHVVYDCRHVLYPGYSAENMKRLAQELHNPVILTEEEFSMVEEITEDGEAVLSQDYVHEFKPFVERIEGRARALTRIPVRAAFRGEKEPSPEEIRENEREAAERMQKKEVREQTMSREAADRMRDQAIDRKMSQDQER